MQEPQEIKFVDARRQFSVYDPFYQLLKLNNPQTPLIQVCYIILTWGITLLLPVLVTSISKELGPFALIVAPIIIGAIDFYWLFPNALLRDKNSKVLNLVAATTISNQGIRDSISKWILPQVILHLVPSFCIYLLFTSVIGELPGAGSQILFGLSIIAIWSIMYGVGIISVFQSEARINRGVLYSMSIGLIFILFVASMFATAGILRKWVFVNILDNDSEIVTMWMGIWFTLLLLLGATVRIYMNHALRTWRRSF